MRRLIKKILRTFANHDPTYYDMYRDPNESLFARLYLDRLLEHCGRALIRPPAEILDAGCQTGRLLIPLTKEGYRLTGIDGSAFALKRAASNMRAEGVKARLIRARLPDGLGREHDGRYGVVLCAEVLYLCRDYRAILERLAACVRPGGLLCISHRPQSYYLMETLKAGKLEQASSVMQQREGPLLDSDYFNWQTEEELRKLYARLGFGSITLYPIDQFAWLGGLDLSALSQAQQGFWLQNELQARSDGGYCARYVLVVAARG